MFFILKQLSSVGNEEENGFILCTCLQIFLGEFGLILLLFYCCSKGILTLKKKKNSQANSRIFQYRSEELRNHLFSEHKYSVPRSSRRLIDIFSGSVILGVSSIIPDTTQLQIP